MTGLTVHSRRAGETGLLVSSYSHLSDAARVELDVAVHRFLPNAPLSWMIGLGADAVAAEIASAPRVAAPA